MKKDQFLQIVSKEQALKLKSLGFSWEDIGSYYNLEEDSDYLWHGSQENMNTYPMAAAAPTVSLALKWIRDVQSYDAIIIPMIMGNGKKMYHVDYFYDKIKDSDVGIYVGYEEAESNALNHILKRLLKS